MYFKFNNLGLNLKVITIMYNYQYYFEFKIYIPHYTEKIIIQI